MDIRNPESWAKLLMDVGKRNNLINYKDTKASSVEVLLPDISTIFGKIDQGASFSVYDPKIPDDDENESADTEEKSNEENDIGNYYSSHARKVKKDKQLLLYHKTGNPIPVLRNIKKKADLFIEETGVNIAHMVFGFVHWQDKDDKTVLSSPLLIVPVKIEHASAVSPYRIRFEESAAILNPTFEYKMSNEYQLYLPEYQDEGLDLYVEKIRGMVEKLGWKVSYECKIGLFSFLKVNMYRDLLDNRDAVIENKHIRMLLGLSPLEEDTPSSDEAKGFADFHSIVDADFSQLEAVKMAKAGRSFVLQGPPGTGKSQTIANIIAEALYDGKRVLFVAEKLAALDVVNNTLRKKGLGEFCLPLHSHKSNKKEVIDKLCSTLRAPKSGVDTCADTDVAEWTREAAKLDEYTEKLHIVRPVIQKSLYQLFESYFSYRESLDTNLQIPEIEKQSEEMLVTASRLLAQYGRFVKEIGENWRDNVWYGYKGTDSSTAAHNLLLSDLQKVTNAIPELNRIAAVAAENGVVINSLRQTEEWGRLCRFILDNDILTPALFDRNVLSYVLERLVELRSLADGVMTFRNSINKDYLESIYKLQGAEGYAKLLRKQTSRISRLLSKQYRSIISELKTYSIDGKRPTYEEAVNVLDLLTVYDKKLKEFVAKEQSVITLLGSDYKGIYTNWDGVMKHLEEFSLITKLLPDLEGVKTLSPDEFKEKKKLFCIYSDDIAGVLENVKESVDRISSQFDPTVFNVSDSSLADLSSRTNAYLEDFGSFETWCQFNILLGELNTVHLIPFIHEAYDRGISPDSIEGMYCKAFFGGWIEHILVQNPELRRFSRIAHDQSVEIFSARDLDRFEINRARIREAVSSRRPSLDLVSPDSAVAMLMREGEKKRRQKTIRTLISEASDLVLTLTPCLLMSPLSVSTFLGPDIKFDLVIFDEASQIFPQDAIGAIYRANQVIVVGDSRQMPPTNFFNATFEDHTNENEESVSDYESILDIASAVFPQIRLKWHYRSRFESLIAFSNSNFYNNELITFPSAIHGGEALGVEYYNLPDGVFEHGKRVNRKEAEFVVDLIYRHIAEYPDRSLGVVAFNVPQQELIDKLLMKRRRENGFAEEFFSSDRPEPFFIKNLETVQGDERDTIIFSIAYAKDDKGKFIQNFGPLNRVGGERRLNVAVTRAKYNTKVVASIHSSDIEVSESSLGGVRAFKNYLEYAEHKTLLSADVTPFVTDANNMDLEKSILEFLENNGYKVEQSVGNSTYPIDIAVVDLATGNYALAVECDGANYYRLGNTRDRNRLRPSVLSGMGWEHYRIWSVDWISNPSMERTRLLNALNKALNKSKEEEANEAEKSDRQEETTSESVHSYEKTSYDEPFSFPSYRESDMPLLTYKFSGDVKRIIYAVIQNEAPISEEWLITRIAPILGFDKPTKDVVKFYESCISDCTRRGILRRDGFLYLVSAEKISFRVPIRMPREIKYISPEELSAGMIEILKRNKSVDKHTLYLMIAKLLGFNRIGSAGEQRLDEALAILGDLIVIDGNEVKLKE